MKTGKRTASSAISLLLSLLLIFALLLTSGCGNKPQPDPSLDNDVSTGVSQDENSQVDDTTGIPDESVDTTDDSSDAMDESSSATDESSDATDESGDATDESGDAFDTTTKGNGKITTKTTAKKGDTTNSAVKTTTKKGDATKSTVKTTTKKGDTTKSTVKTTTKKGSTTKSTKTTTKSTTKDGGIIINKTTTTTRKETTTSTSREINQSTKDKILSLFDDSMRGKTASFLIHYVAKSDTDKLMQMYDETGIKIKFHIAEYDTLGTRLSALINATASPDVAYIRSEQYAPLINKGVMTDIGKLDFNTKLDIYDQELINIFTWNDQKFGISTKNSVDANFTVLYYNKAIFDRYGVTDPGTLWKQGKWNWNTFVSAAQAVNDSAAGRWGCEIYDTSIFLCSGGVGVISMGNGEIVNNLNDQRIIDAWTFINKLHHEYKVTTGLAGAEENFVNGKSVMLVGESWMWGKGNPISTTKDEWGVVPAPLAPNVLPSAIINPRAACVPIGAKNPKMGLAVYTYWTSNDTFISDPTDNPNAEEDAELYPYHNADALDAFYSQLWDMPKIADLSSSVIEYGGEYTRWDFSFEIFQAGMSGINSSIDKWKSAIDVNIKRIMTEFS